MPSREIMKCLGPCWKHPENDCWKRFFVIFKKTTQDWKKGRRVLSLGTPMFCWCLIYFLLLSTAFPVLPQVKPPSNAPIANVSGIQNRQLRVSLSGLLQAQVMKMRMAPLPRSSEPWFEYVQRNFPWDDESQPHGLLFLSSISWIVILLNIQLSALYN